MKWSLALVASLALTGCAGQMSSTSSQLSHIGFRDTLASLGCGRIHDACGTFHGSCFAIDIGSDLVVTARHVVVDTVGQLYVEGVPAEIVRLDERSDLALLRARGHPLRRLPLRVAHMGETAWAMGYVGVDVTWEEVPLGGVAPNGVLLLPHLLSQTGSAQRGITPSGATATKGSVSAMNAHSYIQFDGGVQPGMSGGPLIGEDGAALGCLSHCVSWGNSPMGDFSVNSPFARYARASWIYELAQGVRDDDPALSAPQTFGSQQSSPSPTDLMN